MKGIKKKTINILLVIAMVVSMFGTSVVHAAEATQDLIIAEKDQKIEVTADRNTTLSVTQNTTIIMKANAAFSVTSGNAIQVKAGVTLTIVLNGFTLDVKTSATSKAGIFLPRNSTLIVREGSAKNGTLNVTGGPGTAPEMGLAGKAASGAVSGIGGKGGRGGDAPGAGIGGNGGAGANGAQSVGSKAEVSTPYQLETGGNGSAGADSGVSDSMVCGNVFIFGDININVIAGKHEPSKIISSHSPASYAYDGGGIGCSGGGAGGDGGSAYGAAGIGGGGIGGGGGGAGGGGSAAWMSPGYRYSAGGGGGGAGQTGGNGGTGSKDSVTTTITKDGSSGGRHTGGAGGIGAKGTDRAYGAGSGGSGGSSSNLIDEGKLGTLYYDKTANVTINNSPGSTENSATNKRLDNKIILLSECIIEVNDSNIIYDGNTKTPDIILKDKNNNVITSQLNTNYSLAYTNNIDAGEKTGIVTIKSNGSITDENYLMVDGGSYDIKFTIKPNEEPLSITKADGTYTYIYGSSFRASVNKHTANAGVISWDSVIDADYKAEIANASTDAPEIIPTKVGKMKLRVTITQDQKNANGVYNFPEIMSATFDTDIQINPKNIDDGDIGVPNVGPYTYVGGQIRPTYTETAYQSGPITFNTNRDIAHKILEEGVDFELKYEENTNVADGGSVKIIGIGNYENNRNKTLFTINARDINDPSVTTSAESPAYTGNSLEVPPVVKIKDTNMGTEYTLPKTDYTLSWASKKKNEYTGVDLINVGEKQITITGSGNLTNTRKQEYKIQQADIGTIGLGIERAKDVYFDGKEIESRPKIEYYENLLTEKGTTADQDVDVPNPDDYEIAFSNHKEAGATTTTLTGVNNFKGTKVLTGSEQSGYDVLKRPLYILPDGDQWKYYGASDIYGINQTIEHPTYRVFTRILNDAATKEEKDADLTKDELNRQYIKDNPPISGYQMELVGNLSREGADNQLLDKRDTTYKYTISDLRLTDVTQGNYQVKLVDNETSYKINSYLHDGTPADIIGVLGKNDWYVENPLEFKAPTNYTISKSDGLDPNVNNWNPKVNFDDGDYSKDGMTYFLRYHNPDNVTDPANGAISSGIIHKFKQDTAYPTGTLTITSDAWTAFNANADFNYFLNSDAIGLLYGKDDVSKVNTKHYYMSDTKLGKDDLDKISVIEKGAGSFNPVEENKGDTWIEGNQFQLNINDYNTKRKYIYVRIEDNAGNVTYLNSDGVVFDKDAPILKAEYKQNGKWTISNDVKITGTVYDENAGLKDRYVAYQIDGGAMQVVKDIQPNGKFEIQNLPDGNYTLTISAWDKADNQAAPISFHVMKDTQTPRILLDANTTTIATEQAITFDPRVGASGVSKLEVSYNDGEWKHVPDGVQTPYIVKENGVYTFRITTGAGVVSKESSIEFTKIDTKVPNIKIEVSDLKGNKIEENDFTNSDLQFMFANVEKNLGNSVFQYSLDNGSTWVDKDENLDNEANVKIALLEGEHTIQVRVIAQNGLIDEKEFHVGIDRTLPKMNISVADAEGGFIRNLLDMFRTKRQVVKADEFDEGSPASGINKVQHYIVEGKTTQGTLPSDAKAIEKMVKERWEDGSECEVEVGSEYIVYFKVADKAGNITYGRSDRIVIDAAVPEIEVSYELEGKWDKDPLMDVYVFDANPGVDKVEYQVDDGVAIEESESFTISSLGLGSGEHTIRIHARDKSGNVSEKIVKVKVDTGVPTISAHLGTPTIVNVPIEVNASYAGASGLDKILLSKNGQEFEDVSDVITREGKYIAEENGDYTFRAVTGAGAYTEVSVNVDEFTALESDIEAVVRAKLASGDDFEDSSWANEDVNITFSNHKANLKGLSYEVKIDEGNWGPVNTANGYLNIPVTTEGSHQYAFRVIHDATAKTSNIASINVNIDKTVPTTKMKIKDIEWDEKALIDNGFRYDSYFKEQEYAIIEATDSLSGVESNEIFAIKEAEIPSSIKGQTTASKIEALGKNRWLKGGSIALDPNDKYVVFGKTYDKAGNVAYVSSDGVVFDDINPTLSSDINQNDWYKDNTTDIQFNVDDNLAEVKNVTYKINDGSPVDATLSYDEFTISTSDLKNGENQIDISVFDHAKNELKTSYLAKKDIESPTITVIDKIGSGKLVTKNLLEVNTTVGSSGISKVEVKKPDAGGWEDITDSYTSGYLAQETGTYWFRVVNGAGNSATTSLTLNNISKNIPIINYIMTSDGSDYFENNWSRNEVSVQFTNENGNQTVAEYLYKVDNGSYKPLTSEKDGTAIFTSIEGRHTYTMKLVLDNGLESEEVSVTILVDAIAPKIQINSDLSHWVKETQELEVEVIDAESGVDSKGYSFDNGYTWQSENKMKVTANKIVGLKAKDAVSNISSEKAIVEKIDSQGPSVHTFTQLGTEKSKIRELEADIDDYCDLTGRTGSGIDKAYAMTTYPYKDGVANPNPDKTFEMEEKNGKWVTEQAITVPYNGTNSVWLVTEDKVGNQKIYSIEVSNMIGSGDEEGNTEKPTPEDPTNPDKPTDPEQPTNPDKPTNPEQPTNPDNPSNPNPIEKPGNGETSTNPDRTNAGANNDVKNNVNNGLANHETSKNDIENGTNDGKKIANELSKVEEDTQKLKNIQKSIENGKFKASKINVVYMIPWILLVIVLIWMFYLFLRYRRFKKSLENDIEVRKKESEEVSYVEK